MGLFSLFSKRYRSIDDLKNDVRPVYNRHYKSATKEGLEEIVSKLHALRETLKLWCDYNRIPYDYDELGPEVLPFSIMNEVIYSVPKDATFEVFCHYLAFRAYYASNTETYYPFDYEHLTSSINKAVEYAERNNPDFISVFKKYRNDILWTGILTDRNKSVIR